jgi:cellulose synthase/poly-beta-1,6-N-acetylglucosamine synthase-like glycosyltransferase
VTLSHAIETDSVHVTLEPQNSAQRVLSPAQVRALIVGALGLMTCFALSPRLTMIAITAIVTLIYAMLSGFRLYMAARSLSHRVGTEISAHELARLDPHQLPVYTILIPLYHEASLLPTIIRAMEALDYPRAKLDVRLLLEADDHDTVAAVRSARLPTHITAVIVPEGKPKGKPRACNYGLQQARGEYVVVYDAEDIPEPDQLKKALIAFERGNDRLVCVQAKLNYFNRKQNALTHWFASEYSMWFDLFLPGLDAMHAPIPLGGTSNHFRIDRLRQVGAWDAYNVTEDADLGTRLYIRGFQTAVIESTTYEEANSEVYNWLRQRSRWVKGYIQTYLVHMRHPRAMWRALGPGAFFSFQCMLGGTPFLLLVNPLLWALTGCWFLTHWNVIQTIFPAPVFYLGCIALYLGNFSFAYLNVAGCLRRGYYDLVRYAVFSPVYWILMSAGAWKGFLQLFYRPSYWEKTVHGLHRGHVQLPLDMERALEGLNERPLTAANRTAAPSKVAAGHVSMAS